MQVANKLPEPDPFTREEFLAWRGFLRVHAHDTMLHAHPEPVYRLAFLEAEAPAVNFA